MEIERSQGFTATIIKKEGYTEYYITSVAQQDEPAQKVLEKVKQFIDDNNASIVSQEIFGIAADDENARSAIDKIFNNIHWPVTWIENNNGTEISGTQCWAISGISLKNIRVQNDVIGNYWENTDATICRLGNIAADDITANESEQTAQVFNKIDQGLALAGMNFSHVVRTWFYNDDILGWYDSFNKVRSKYFNKNNVYNGLIPASTGMGGANHSGSALISGLIAVKPKNHSKVKSNMVPSPLQCPALDYGSSFSRAAEVQFSDHRKLYVSGTASIRPDGKTEHLDDTENQIKLTMDVVEAILKSREMEWSHVTRAIVYLKHKNALPVYEKYIKEANKLKIPAVININDICRDDLLFEIEVDAYKNGVL